MPSLPTGVGLTALCTAREREAENRRPDRLFEDRTARVLTEVIDELPRPTGLPDGCSARSRAFMRDFVALRTRFFDEELRAASQRCRQVVLLGSGLDSRSFRLDWAPGTEVYEVDRTDVLRFRHGILSMIGQEPRCRRAEVGADLRGDWPGALRAAGFNPWRSTAWGVEELLPYLSHTENNQLLRDITAMSAPGSRLVMDHFDRALQRSARFSRLTEDLYTVSAAWRSTLEIPDRWFTPHGWTFALTNPTELARRSGREIPDLFTPQAGAQGLMWLISAAR
ncbi:hypothetical protein BIV24_25970 [Streptomyces colonosanans]|uniref:S-adenosyl-L-methionine-dependent methyltransferase n=1 Tax=Streptomyces colonosanans TaxID=1428652 RepID=A0A1S2NZT0_9ACTN|nr:hypothetical protein BIV24_25970 [Streptomyces colonosanans]